MKINLKLPVLVLGLMLLFAGTTVKAQDDNVSLQQFYDELSPYGTWIQDSEYGYVWRPDVDQADFRPYYTNGRWAMTEYGNTWVSNYNWGWAPFHYGRWIYDRRSNWVWLPDTVWGPAWVDWRSGDGYYGWAPMGPVFNININFGRRYSRPDYCWNFIPQHHIYYNSFPRYRSYNNVQIINRTTIINNTYVRSNRTYYTGPRPEEIRRATNRDVQIYNIARNNRADAPRIDRNTVNIYSPRPSRSENQGNPAPRTTGSYSVNGRADDRNTVRTNGNGTNRDSNPSANRGTANGQAQDRSSSRTNGAVTRDSNSPVASRGTEQDRRIGSDTRPERSTAPVSRREPSAQERPAVTQQRETQRTEAPQRTEQSPPRQDRQMQAPPQRQAEPQQRTQAQPQRQSQVQQSAPSRSERSTSSNGSSNNNGGARSERSGSGRPTRG